MGDFKKKLCGLSEYLVEFYHLAVFEKVITVAETRAWKFIPDNRVKHKD